MTTLTRPVSGEKTNSSMNLEILPGDSETFHGNIKIMVLGYFRKKAKVDNFVRLSPKKLSGGCSVSLSHPVTIKKI